MTFKTNVCRIKSETIKRREAGKNAEFYFQTVFSLRIVSRLSSCFCPNQPAVSHLFLLPSKYLQCGPCSIIVLERQIKKSFVLSFHCLPVLSQSTFYRTSCFLLFSLITHVNFSTYRKMLIVELVLCYRTTALDEKKKMHKESLHISKSKHVCKGAGTFLER